MSRCPLAVLALVAVLASGCGGDDGGGSADGAAIDDPTTTEETRVDDPQGLTADAIPVAHTPPGGYGDDFPPPVLAGCDEPLVDGAPDLRGMWKAVSAVRDGRPVPADDRALQHFQRIEQCGDRLVVTAGGVVHDMRVDGTEANGVHDVAEFDFATPIVVVATYEDGTHVLRPVGTPIEVTRRLDGERLVWGYLGVEVTLERIGEPDDPPPSA